jgi:hypothetical protein
MSKPNELRVAGACITLLAGCLTAMTAFAGKKEAAPRVCVAAPADLTVVSLENHVKQKKGKFALNEKSQCIVTPDGGKLAAVLVELPQFTQSYSVNVRSLLGATVLVPRIDVLNAQKEVRRSLGLTDVRRRGDSLELDVFVTKDSADDRFLLVYADPAAFGQAESRSTMGMQTSYIGTGYWTSGTETKQQINYVDEGTLLVSLKGPQWEKK